MIENKYSLSNSQSNSCIIHTIRQVRRSRMSEEDMSMFRKMKDMISDEVNSATNKLQNIQIIDQFTNSIGQQLVKNNSMSHQILPDLPEHTSSCPANSRFSLIDDNPIYDRDDDEELNSEISPQHQLFNERSIRRLETQDHSGSCKDKNGSNNPNSNHSTELDSHHSVIDIDHLSSDLDDEFEEPSANDDGEIDLLTERITPSSSDVKSDDKLASSRLVTYKTRYRDVVHAFRKLNDDRRLDKFQLESETRKLTDQISVLKEELNNARQQLESTNHSSINHESDKRTNSSSTHQSGKQASKIKDLEELMAKCKESLKAKNAQLKILRNSLNEVDKFRENMNDLKKELKELRNAHETWTLSIAENKRVMHQEIEEKNAEMENMKSQLKDSSNRLMQQKSNIQNLESRLVSMSAAHLKERESLIKELTNTKNIALKRLQKEHELQLERVKLDLEKSIESLKSEILIRDEQIIRGGQRQQELEKQNCDLTTDLENYKSKCRSHLHDLDELKATKGAHVKEIEALKQRLSEIGSNKIPTFEASTETLDEASKIFDELSSKNQEIEQLKNLIRVNTSNQQVAENADMPSSTEFEYLKNIVHQFLMGREPITLARVISAIFKFDNDQMEQICKIQEAIHQVSS